MAGLLICNSHAFSLIYPSHSPSLSTRASLKPRHVPITPQVGPFSGHLLRRRRTRGVESVTVTRAGPSNSTYVFAFVFPLSLLAVTILASIRIADKLDRDYLEELEINEALKEANEGSDDEDEDDGSGDASLEKPALTPRTRNRPKREAEA